MDDGGDGGKMGKGGGGRGGMLTLHGGGSLVGGVGWGGGGC